MGVLQHVAQLANQPVGFRSVRHCFGAVEHGHGGMARAGLRGAVDQQLGGGFFGRKVVQ